MARYKKAERDQIQRVRRQQLLDAASDEFARAGYDGANINRISQAAGFAKGTIYNYFPSKRALMLALIEDIAQKHIAYVTARVRQVETPDRRLEKFFEAGFNFVSEYLPQCQVLITTLYGHDEAFKENMYEAYLPMFQLVGSEIIAPGINQGQFRPVDPQAMAGLLMTIYLGTSSRINEAGQFWLDHRLIADFALHALHQEGSTGSEEAL